MRLTGSLFAGQNQVNPATSQNTRPVASGNPVNQDTVSFSKTPQQNPPRFGSASSTVPDDYSSVKIEDMMSPTPSERGAREEMPLKERKQHYRSVYEEKAGVEIDKRTSQFKRDVDYNNMPDSDAKRALRKADRESNRARVLEWLIRSQEAAERDHAENTNQSTQQN